MKNISCLNAIGTVYLFIQYIKTHYSTWNLRLSCFDEFGEFAFIYLYKKLFNISINLQSQYIKAVLVLVQFEYFKLDGEFIILEAYTDAYSEIQPHDYGQYLNVKKI